MSLEEKLREMVLGDNDWDHSEKIAQRIINEIIKPLTEKAFEAGSECRKDNTHYDGEFQSEEYKRDKEQWQKENLK